MPDSVMQFPIETRFAPINSFDAKARTATVVVSGGAPVKRYDWMRERYYSEELAITSDAVDLTRINGSGVSVLNNHDQYSGLESVLGRASNGRIENKQLIADVRFSQRDEIAGLIRDIGDGIITDVSVGYTRDQIEMIPPDASAQAKGDSTWTYRVTKWTPMEVSFVTVPADPQAGMRGGLMRNASGHLVQAKDGKDIRTFDCQVTEISPLVPAGAETTRKEVTMPEVNNGAGTDKTAENEAVIRAAKVEATKEERKRVADIQSATRAAGLPEAFAQPLIDGDATIDGARAQIIDALAAKQNETKVDGAIRVQMGEAEEVKVRAAIGSAIEHRLDSSKAMPDNGAAEFRNMSLIRMAEEILERRGIKTRGMRKLELATRAFGTTDFTNVLANVMNKRLRQGYDENPGTYQQWAYKAPNAPDFKTITVTQISAAPDFLLKNPGDEFKYGSASDGKESYAMLTYARGMMFTREAMINDDLRAFDRLVTGFGASARRLENRAAYVELVKNANLSDGVALFNAATHKNYTSTGTVISNTSLAVARTLMRKQTGLQGEVLNLAPKFLIVPAAQEQLAYQWTSPLYQPNVATNINEFRGGGKTAVETIVEAQLDSLTSLDGATDYSSGTAWYLAADSGQVDTIEYCYLDGYDGVWLEQAVDFDTDGLKFKGRLDFAAKAVDYRGLYKNVGA